MGDLRLGIMVEAVDNASGKLNGIAGNVAGATKKMEGGLWSAGEAGDEARMKLASMGQVATQAGMMLTAAGGAITGAMALAVNGAMKQEQMENRLRVVFGDNTDALGEYASELQKMTRFGDEATLEAMALGASFKGLKPYIKEATVAAMNMSEVTGMDLKAAMMLIGKVADGNVGALSRYGIKLDETRLKTEGAAYIAKAVTERFNNAAIETDNASKRFAQFKNAVGDVGEEIGAALLPMISAVTPMLTSMAQAFGKLAGTPLGKFLTITTAALGLFMMGAGAALIVAGQLASAITALASASAVLGGAGGLGAVIKGLVGVQGSAGLAAKGVGGLGKMFLMTPPHVAIAVAAIALLAYELWKLKGVYDEAKKAADEANRSFAQSQKQKEWGVQTGRLDATTARRQAREVAEATPTLGERWTGMWMPGMTSKQLAQTRVFAEQAAPLSGVSQRRTAVAGHRGAPTVSAGMRRSTQAQTQVNVYVGDKPLEEKMYEVQQRSARGAYATAGAY